MREDYGFLIMVRRYVSEGIYIRFLGKIRYIDTHGKNWV